MFFVFFCYVQNFLLVLGVGFKNIFEMQQAEHIIAPSIRFEGKLMQQSQHVGMYR